MTDDIQLTIQRMHICILNCSLPVLCLCSGTLPNASHVFPQTRVIDLAYNSLTGSIPAAFNTSGVFNSSLVRSLCASHGIHDATDCCSVTVCCIAAEVVCTAI